MLLLTLIAILTLMPQTLQAQSDSILHFGDYRLDRSYRSMGGSGYQILKNDQQVYEGDVAGFDVISVAHGKQIDSPEPTVTDITGDGIPDLVIEEYPRNPGCCFTYSIFSLGPKFKEVAHLTGFPSPMTFEDLNKDSIYEITGQDMTLVSKYASPRIVFAYRKGEYELATNLMRKAAPTAAQLAARVRKFGAANSVYAVDPQVYSYMVDLIFSGNARSAWRVLDLAWPASKPGKDEFRSELISDLQKSPYWTEIRTMNGTALSESN